MTDGSMKTMIGERVVIYPRGKGRVWTAEFHHDGRHCRKTLKTKRKDQAMLRAAKLAEELDTGEFQPKARNPLIDEANMAYLEFLKSQGLAGERSRATGASWVHLRILPGKTVSVACPKFLWAFSINTEPSDLRTMTSPRCTTKRLSSNSCLSGRKSAR